MGLQDETPTPKVHTALTQPDTALKPSQNGILAVELDSFDDEWDPTLPHVGIDVKSLRSVNTTDWPIDEVPFASIGKARISYEFKTKTLSVLISYSDTDEPARFASLSQIIDLKGVLPEYFRIGFSAATGDLVETHNILSWSLSSFLAEESSS